MRRATSTIPYGLAEHRHRFAVWAAARAAQRGFTTVKNLREALEATDIQSVLAASGSLELSSAQFDALHRVWCRSICSFLAGRGIRDASYGRAAKLVGVYLKAIVIMGGDCDSPLGRNAHPPIDRVLLHRLAASARIGSPHRASWASISWTQLDEPRYFQLIGQLRSVLPQGAPFWTLEEYWEPSESG
jgi:hypothetical protein